MSTSRRMPNLCTSMAAMLGVGAKQEQETMTMSTCKRSAAVNSSWCRALQREDMRDKDTTSGPSHCSPSPQTGLWACLKKV